MEGEQRMEQTTKSGRQVRPTEAGMEYQREMKTKAFNRQLRELNRLTEKIVGDDDAIIPDTGKRELKEWTHCYINLLQTLSDMRTLLTPDQLDLLEKDSGLKSQRTQTLKTQIQDTLEKLRKTEATPSVVSRASRASLSSVRASLKLLQMQDEHQRAALKVKQSAVLKRRQIEQEKQAIKWKEEDLDLEVEFNIVEEKRKALQKFETELEVDMPASTEQTAPTVNVPAAAEHSQVAPALGTSAGAAEAYELHPQHSEEREAPTQVLSAVQDSSIPAGMSGDSSAAAGLHHELNVDAACFKPSNSLPQKQQKTAEDKHMMQGPTDLSDLFAEQRRGRLPALEPEIFQGSVDKFHSWMKAFESFIESRTSSPAERLHYLSRYTGGEARTVIEGFFLLRTSDAYDRAKKKLYDRFGNDFIVASAYRKKLKEWPMIRAGDGKGLRRLADYLDSCLMVSHHVSGLESLSDCNQNNEILRKLPKHIVDKWKRVVDRRLFEPDAGAQPAYPLFGEFVEFLNREARIECGPVDTPERSSLAGRDIQVRNRGLKESARTFISSAASEKETDDSPRCQLLQPVKTQPRWTCKVCGQQHAIDACNTFKAMSSEERHVAVKQYGLCRGCLRPGHIWKECRNRRRCEKCGYSHPTLLHDDSRRRNMTSVKKPADSSNSRTKQSSDVETRATTLKVGVDGDRQGSACLHTMIVPVILRSEDDPNRQAIVYAVLDPQSDACFVTETTLRKLGSKGEKITLQLSTMTGKATVNSYRVTGLSVQGLMTTDHIKLPATYSRAEIPAERSLIPRASTLQEWKHLEHLAEELPPHLPDAEIGLLIGMNCPRAVKPREIIPGNGDDPWAIRTELGWSVVGFVAGPPSTLTCHCVQVEEAKKCHFVFKTQVREVSPMEVARMFEADFRHEPAEKKVSQEDRQFLKVVEENFHQRPDKHFEGPLPLKDQNVSFPDNKKLALKRLFCLKRRFAYDRKFKDDYNRFMMDSLAKGYAERVPEDELKIDDGKVWFLPHHGVYHAKKEKIRVVYDCSAEYQGFSLNSNLLQGPDYVNNMVGVITRFRRDKVAISCDIQEMFNQVSVSEGHRNLLRFLWWENNDTSTEPIQYRMTTHLFGAISSPACAMYALNATAEKYAGKHGQEAADFVRGSFYVDDGLISVSDADAAVRIARSTIDLCADGGFRLHKFVSNDQSVIARLPPDSVSKDKTSVDVSLHHPTYEQALGVKWDTEMDTLHINVNIPDRPVTRRGILSTVSSLYDPVGLISPVILKGKLFVKLLCCDGYDWDEPVPEEVAASWLQWKETVPLLSEISVPRCYVSSKGKIKTYELHHFSDASTFGYGQASYIRTVDEYGHICSSLVISKAKVTPKRTVTIPRLELTAAVLSVNVARFLEKELNIQNLQHFYWTDSMVVLGYIRNEVKRFQVFVANRVQQIREYTTPDQWRFVKSEDNPADLASRGIEAGQITNCDLWWHGPKFLVSSTDLPVESEFAEVPDDDPEVKKARVLVTTTQGDDSKLDLQDRLTRFSSWFRAKKAIAICLRYRRRLLYQVRRKNQDNSTTTEENGSESLTEKPIDADELQMAEVVILKNVQRLSFRKEMAALKAQQDAKADQQCVEKRSDIYRLDPFLSQDGLLRVGGRMRRGDQPRETAHPVILPKDHHVSRLIIAHFHEKTRHSGRGVTLSEIRLSGFWIVRGRSAVSRHIQRCVRCIKIRGRPCSQKMSDLPVERVEQAEPFTYSGCDCFGPFIIKERRSELKRWGIVFTCMSSRAVHLETLNSLTADAFINAYRRFVSRRGPIRKLFCDNATNFIGGEGYLAAALSEMDRGQIRKTLLKDNCDFVEFHHITPRASHMGGSWERQIRSVRAALNSLFQETGHQIDDELLRTVMAEAEGIVNSRPLSYACMTDTDLVEPITPSQILTLKQKVVLSLPGNFSRPDLYVRQRWRRVQYLADQFWVRWRREFLPTLQERRKWNRAEPNLQPGDVVIAIDEDAPRCDWPMGRVVCVHPSSDALVRSVRVRIGHSEYDRPIHKLISVLKM